VSIRPYLNPLVDSIACCLPVANWPGEQSSYQKCLDPTSNCTLATSRYLGSPDLSQAYRKASLKTSIQALAPAPGDQSTGEPFHL